MRISEQVLLMCVCIYRRCRNCVLLQHSAFIWGSNTQEQTESAGYDEFASVLHLLFYHLSVCFSSCEGYKLSGSNSCIYKRWHLLQEYLKYLSKKFLLQLLRSLLQLVELAALCRSSVTLLVLAMLLLPNRVLWHLIKLHFSLIPYHLLTCSCPKAGFLFEIEKLLWKKKQPQPNFL